MAIRQGPSLNISALTINGLATVVFPSRPYRRVVRSVVMLNPAGGRVVIYKGTGASVLSQVSAFPQGADQEYTVPFNLPSGQSVIVQWAVAPSPVSDARAILTWMEDV